MNAVSVLLNEFEATFLQQIHLYNADIPYIPNEMSTEIKHLKDDIYGKRIGNNCVIVGMKELPNCIYW